MAKFHAGKPIEKKYLKQVFTNVAKGIVDPKDAALVIHKLIELNYTLIPWRCGICFEEHNEFDEECPNYCRECETDIDNCLCEHIQDWS